MPALGLSQKSFKTGQNTFKVFGDSLGSSNVSTLTTSAPHFAWQNPQTVGHSQNHVGIQATLASTTSEKPKDTIGDLTVTVTDNSGQSATTTFTPVTYTP